MKTRDEMMWELYLACIAAGNRLEPYICRCHVDDFIEYAESEEYSGVTRGLTNPPPADE